MRILGIDIKRSSPPVRVVGSAFDDQRIVNEVALATGRSLAGTVRAAASVNPLVPVLRTPSPVSSTPTFNVKLPDGRQIPSDPRDSWMWSLPDKLTPKQVMVILRAALAGDCYRMTALSRLMQETWPMFRNCSHAMRDPVANTRYTAKAYTKTKGAAPSRLAQEKADLISRAMKNFAPTPFTDERGFIGMVYDLCDAMLIGMSTGELMWHPLTDWGSGREYLPRAFAWAHPRHFSFSQAGVLTLANPGWSQLYTWPLQAASSNQTAMTSGTLLDPTKFLCAQFKSGSGSTLAEGYTRVMALDWTRVMFAQEWMFVAAQNFGSPHVDFTFKPNVLSNPAELNKMLQLIEDGLSNRVFAHAEGTTLTMMPPGTASNDPQEKLMDKADQHCMELFFGTEATTKATAGKLGGSNENDPHAKTKRDRVQGLANWVCAAGLSYFVDAVLYMNYGRNPAALAEKPSVEPDFTEPLTPQEKGAVVTAFGTCNVPIPTDDFYSMLGVQVPEEGDKVIVPATGKIGVLGSTEEDLDVSQPDPIPPGMDADGNPLAPQGGEEDGNEEGAPGKKAVPVTKASLARILAKATDAELFHLIPLAEAADKAVHHNGEHALLQQHLEKINNRK